MSRQFPCSTGRWLYHCGIVFCCGSMDKRLSGCPTDSASSRLVSSRCTAASCSVRYGFVRLVGQELAPSKCPHEYVWGGQEGRVIGFYLMVRRSGLSSLMSWTLVCIWILPLGLVWYTCWLFLDWSLFFFLPLELPGRIRVVRTMFIPGALHGIEASAGLQ